MVQARTSAKEFFNADERLADLGLIAVPGAEELTAKIDRHLLRWAQEAGMDQDTFIIESECPRFSSGDGKGLIRSTVRGDDIYFVVDVGNYNQKYKIFGHENFMSPDDHFQNLKRLIQATSGKAKRMSVIMPLLYGSRQHRRAYRESLDCAVALQELQAMGISNIVTFDAHDPRMQNAVPLMGFDNVMPTYQVLKAMLRAVPDLQLDRDHFMVISPDEGAMNRNMYYASVLGVNLGMFYKRRDYSQVVNGRNPIVAHEYLGESVEGKDVFMTVGAAASLTCTLNAVTNPGDEVIVIAPYFPEYRVWIEKAGCTCVEALANEDTFQLSVDNVLKAISDKTAAVIIDSPNNPTGAVYTRDTLTRLANILREVNAKRDPENPIMLISDEPYREIVYGAEVPWVPSIYEHTIVCYSYSKSLSLPGERVGWILVPNTNPQAARLMPAVAGAARTLGFVCAPALFQRVIIDCIDEPSDVEAYARNRTALTDALAEYGYTYVEPDGAFYLWVKALEPDANAFCERAKKYELLAVPSDSFGMPGWFRLGYCVSYETIVNSLPAWKQLADEYRQK